MSRGTFSTLQFLLKQAYSSDVSEQQQASIELANLIEQAGTFPAVSFGPLAHSLSKLLPSTDRTVATYSGRALKYLVLDDALRHQTIAAGVPSVVVQAVNQWEDEILVLRELLGIIQTLCWDGRTVKAVLQCDVIENLFNFAQSVDNDVATLSISTLANIYSFSDTLLLADNVTIESLGQGLPVLFDILQKGLNRNVRFYSMAAVANASAHPRLQSILKNMNCMDVFRDIERQSLMNVHEFGSKMSECATVAVHAISDKIPNEISENNNKFLSKYRFKWGTQPTMELLLASYGGAPSTALLFWYAVY